MERGAEQIKLAEETSERRNSRKGQHENCHASREPGRALAKSGEVNEIVAAGLTPHESDDAECADEREGVDGGVEESRAEAVSAAGDQTEQGVTGVRDCGVSEKAAHVRLRERDEVANERSEERRVGKGVDLGGRRI